jgi:ferric-dicitrate binding protein FerR (iron transport regulator)
MDLGRLLQLAQKLQEGTATPEEYDELAQAIKADESGELAGRLAGILNQTVGQEKDFDAKKWEAAADRILSLDHAAPTKKPARLIYFARQLAAAVIIILLGAGIYFLLNRHASKDNVAATAVKKEIQAPSSSNAMLTLANGQKIMLDSASNGVLSVQGNRNVVLKDGQINYVGKESGNDFEQPLYNTLTVPRGSKIVSVVLSDGSKVWLNSESSLRYPISFAGPTRGVELTGEGYFEVAKNVSRPFIVSTGETSVRVLGTSFNVNAYTNENSIRVTLVEGSVHVSKHLFSKILKPQQQAVINDDIQVHSSFDMEEVLAWKNGRFAFNGSDIQQVMHELARWYDLDVVYTKEIKEKFHVEMTRNTNLSNVFKILEETGGVHFKIDGKKIMVMP